MSGDDWGVVGQADAVAQLRASAEHPTHAYLLVGTEGAGAMDAALAFAGELLANAAGGEDAERHRRLARSAKHPALTVVRRDGAAISRDQLRSVVAHADMQPAEGTLQVFVLTEFHLVTDAAPMLLKTLEEPSPGTVFIVLADDVPPELVTIASRCVRIDVPPLALDVVVRELMAGGVTPDLAMAAATISAGDLARAVTLANDPNTLARWKRFGELRHELDGTTAAAVAATKFVLSDIDEALSATDAVAAAELVAAQEEAERYGRPASSTKALADRHHRERRRLRLDLLRAGVAAIVASYRTEAATSPEEFVRASEAAERWSRHQANNPREDLALLRLFVDLEV